MNNTKKPGTINPAGLLWLMLIVLQPTWHALAPVPMGNQSWTLAIIAVLPLLLPAWGIWAGNIRSWTWGGYLSMLYFIVGVMEAWSNPPQRWLAMTQVIIVIAFIYVIIAHSKRKSRRERT
jgi:uncharacterized membrane protein